MPETFCLHGSLGSNVFTQIILCFWPINNPNILPRNKSMIIIIYLKGIVLSMCLRVVLNSNNTK